MDATTLVPAALATVTAIIGGVLAYAQWRRQHSFERQKSFFADRAAAYKELWERLERVEVRLRAVDNLRDEDFDEMVRDLNAYIMGAEIYFEPGVRERARAYVEAARRMSQIIKSYPADLQRQQHLTMDGLMNAEDMTELFEAWERSKHAREVILNEVRTYLRA